MADNYITKEYLDKHTKELINKLFSEEYKKKLFLNMNSNKLKVNDVKYEFMTETDFTNENNEFNIDNYFEQQS